MAKRDSRPERPEVAHRPQAQRAEAGQNSTASDSGRLAKARFFSEKMLTRSLSGFLYALLIVVCLWFGPITTAIVFTAMAWLCCSEFFRLTRMMGRIPNEFIGLTAAVIFPILPLLPPTLTPLAFSLLVLAAGVWYVWVPQANIADAALTVFAPIYTGYMASAVVSVRLLHVAGEPYNSLAAFILTLGVIASIWTSDATAYFVGSRFGRTKMAPKISPNKTWEGFMGGFIGSVLIWIVLWLLKAPGVTLLIALVGGVAVAIIGVVGDLFESRLKRTAGVKDSGNLIPGHGGMLDRTDSILFGVMCAYFILRLGGLV